MQQAHPPPSFISCRFDHNARECSLSDAIRYRFGCKNNYGSSQKINLSQQNLVREVKYVDQKYQE